MIGGEGFKNTLEKKYVSQQDIIGMVRYMADYVEDLENQIKQLKEDIKKW